MVHPVLIGGAIAVGGKLIADALDEPPEHDELLEDTYDAIEAAVDDELELPTDHGVGDDTDDTLSIDGIEGRPDLVLKGFEVRNTIIEVETADAIENRRGHVIEQIEGFRTNGYSRLLVVPDDAVEAAKELVEEIGGTVHVRTPGGVVGFVQ